MTKDFFVYDPALKELSKELREALATGRMKWEDAMEVMKVAIRKSIKENAQPIKDVGGN